MDRQIYLAMAGAKATMQRQEVLANNLANASTNGFRAELQAFRAVPVIGDGASTRVYALESTVGHDNRSGPVQATGRPGPCRSAPKACSSRPPVCRYWATVGRSRCRSMPRSTSRPTASSPRRSATAVRSRPGG